MLINKHVSAIIILTTLLTALCTNVHAQQTEAGEAKIQYKNQNSVSPLIHSNGLGINYRRGKHLTGFSQKYSEFELVNMKHPKEIKTQNSFSENSKGYVYGKQNSVLVFRTGFGIQKAIFTKENVGAVEFRYIAFIGPSVAFAKPIYLEIRPANPSIEYNITTEKFDPDKHDSFNIDGKAPYGKGLGETKIYPGAYGKFAISVEHAPEDDMIRAIETGITFDFYGRSVPIMALQNNKPFFLNLYISLVYGRKWF